MYAKYTSNEKNDKDYFSYFSTDITDSIFLYPIYLRIQFVNLIVYFIKSPFNPIEPHFF